MASNFQQYLVQTGSSLHETGDNFAFAMADWDGDGRPDLFIIKKNQTGTGSTEVSVLSGASNFQDYLLQTGTPQHETGDNFAFAVGKFSNGSKPDLFIIKKNQTGSGTTEVSVLSGDSNYQQFLLQTATPMHETGDNYTFAVSRYQGSNKYDLFIIKKNQTGSGSTEIGILTGESNFQEFKLQTGTPLHETGDNFDFAVADWNNDGWPDFIIIKKNQTGTGSTEVSVLSGAVNFQEYLLQTGTPQHETDGRFAFAVADYGQIGECCLAVIKKNGTGTGSTEISLMR